MGRVKAPSSVVVVARAGEVGWPERVRVMRALGRVASPVSVMLPEMEPLTADCGVGAAGSRAGGGVGSWAEQGRTRARRQRAWKRTRQWRLKPVREAGALLEERLGPARRMEGVSDFILGDGVFGGRCRA